MSDLKDSNLLDSPNNQQHVRKRAEEVWQKSFDYGKWKFREESSECSKVMERMKERTEEMRQKVKDKRKKKEKIKNIIHVIEDDGLGGLDNPIEAPSDSQSSTTSSVMVLSQTMKQPNMEVTVSKRYHSYNQSQVKTPHRTFSKTESFDTDYGDPIDLNDIDLLFQVDKISSRSHR